jgi:hypothetical protein
MNDATHTPGPWVVDDRHAPAIEVVGSDGYGVGRAHVIGISPRWRKHNPEKHWNRDRECRRDRTPREAEANARLMAAAPDLLDACRYVLRFLDEYDVSGDLHPSLRAKVGAAVAKATTESARAE